MYLKFLREFITDHKNIGAIAPSSSALARQMVSQANVSSASAIVEYGPGTGVFTSEILAGINGDTCFFAIENNPRMATMIRKRFPDVPLYQDSVENLPRILQDVGQDKIDCIVSGLPWASFDSNLQDKLLQTSITALQEGGTFATFTYLHSLLLPAARRFRKKLKQQFSKVSTSPVVWQNLPPAFVYQCTK